MQSFLFLRGIFIGLALGVPAGPVGLLCIRRSLTEGTLIGFVVGLGAALGDTFLGTAAGLGISMVSSFMETEKAFLRIAGGLALIIVGIISFRRRRGIDATEPMQQHTVARDVAGTFLITISNPATILSAMGVVAAVGVQGHYGPEEIGLLVSGIFLGSAFWFLTMAGIGGLVRARLSADWMVKLKGCLGIVLIVFGTVFLANGLLDPRILRYFR